MEKKIYSAKIGKEGPSLIDSVDLIFSGLKICLLFSLRSEHMLS